MTDVLRPTKLGAFIAVYSTMTPIAWWRTIWKEANRIADEDGDLELFFQERIRGLTQMQERFYELQPGVSDG